jgi:hypothetical protein
MLNNNEQNVIYSNIIEILHNGKVYCAYPKVGKIKDIKQKLIKNKEEVNVYYNKEFKTYVVENKVGDDWYAVFTYKTIRKYNLYKIVKEYLKINKVSKLNKKELWDIIISNKEKQIKGEQNAK